MVDLANLVTLPLRLTVQAVRFGLSIANDVASTLTGRHGDSTTVSIREPGPSAETVAPPPRPRRPPEPPPPPEPPAPAHVSEEPVLVEEFGEPGAEESPGAQITVGEPWHGYRRMTAPEIIDRIASASREELAVVELYETTHRSRKSVLAAAVRRLKQLSPPR